MSLEELDARHRQLVEQARRLEATENQAETGVPEKHALPSRADTQGRLEVQVDGAWYLHADAVELTRAALFALDAELDAAEAEVGP